MDYGTYQGLFTLVLIILFVALFVQAFSKGRKKEHDDAANLIFDEKKKKDDSTQESNSND